MRKKLREQLRRRKAQDQPVRSWGRIYRKRFKMLTAQQYREQYLQVWPEPSAFWQNHNGQ